MWINREIEAFFKQRAAQKACVVLTGARQTGKSSLLGRLYPGVKSVSLDIPRLAGEAENSGEAFLERYLPTPLILDEVQNAPKLFPYLKHVIDKKPGQVSQYFLTGSDKFQLMESVSESLSGRASILELHSLSMREIESHFFPLSQKKAEGSQLWTWILQGGYPELHQKNLPSEHYYGDYIATYIERDVRRILNVKNLRLFNRFMSLLSHRTGQLISYQNIAVDLGVSANTIKEWIHVLEMSNIIAIVEPWWNNARKRVVKTPKLYFLDTGILCYLLGVHSPEDLVNSSYKGNVFENHVFCEMFKSCWNRGVRPNIYFFQDHAANEIDFVIHHGGNFTLYEVKASEDPKVNLKPFLAFQKSYPKAKLKYSYVTTARAEERKKVVSDFEISFIDSLSF